MDGIVSRSVLGRGVYWAKAGSTTGRCSSRQAMSAAR
jgi:hypothetical protein